jgi:hypothetical protein
VNVDSRGRGVCEPQVAGCDDAMSNHAGLSASAARPAVRFFRRLWGPSLCCWTVAFSLSRKGLAVRWPARCIEARYENGRDDEHPPRQRLRRQLTSRFRTGRRAACGVQRSACSSDMLLADSRRRCTSSRLPGHSAPRAPEQQACIPASDRSRDPGPRRAIGARNIVVRRSVAANASRLLPILAHKVWGREYLRARSLAVAFSRAIPIGTPADASGRHAERK